MLVLSTIIEQKILHAFSHLFICRPLQQLNFSFPKTYSPALGDREVRVKRKTICCDWRSGSGKSNKDTAMESMPDYKLTCTLPNIAVFMHICQCS